MFRIYYFQLIVFICVVNEMWRMPEAV